MYALVLQTRKHASKHANMLWLIIVIVLIFIAYFAYNAYAENLNASMPADAQQIYDPGHNPYVNDVGRGYGGYNQYHRYRPERHRRRNRHD